MDPSSNNENRGRICGNEKPDIPPRSERPGPTLDQDLLSGNARILSHELLFSAEDIYHHEECSEYKLQGAVQEQDKREACISN